jgi:hypothetical protein
MACASWKDGELRLCFLLDILRGSLWRKVRGMAFFLLVTKVSGNFRKFMMSGTAGAALEA